MDLTCFVFINACALWWLKLEPQTLSSATLGIVSCMHVDPPSRSVSLGGRMFFKLRRGSVVMHRLSVRQAETENHLSSRLDEGAQELCRRPF
jgi:hypothetical protein